MTDLTDKWKKGELPEGWYWVKDSRAEGIYAYTAEYLNNMYRPRNSERIIEKVPNYEEWKAKLEENTKLKTENKWYSEQLNEAVKKIDKLKEQKKPTSDCKTLAQKLLQVKPELREWLETNYGEYL